LAYHCDIFAKLYQLNISLQGKDNHLLQPHDKITAFKRKLQVWKTDLLINNEQCDRAFKLTIWQSLPAEYRWVWYEDCDVFTFGCSNLAFWDMFFWRHGEAQLDKKSFCW